MKFSRGERVAGRYLVADSLGAHPGYEGYRVVDTEVEVDVELWAIEGALFPSDAARAGLRRSTTSARELAHLNARRLFDAGDAGACPYAAVQLSTGAPLAGLLAAGVAVDDDLLLNYAVAIGSALVAGHALGLVHGRLLPADIVDASGAIKLGGIGLWSSADPAACLRAWGDQARYLAPEVAAEAPTSAADAFSLAVVLTELATGAAARWRAAGDPGLLRDRLTQLRPELPPELGAALAVEPAARPSVSALVAALAQGLGSERTPRFDTEDLDTVVRRRASSSELATPNRDEPAARRLPLSADPSRPFERQQLALRPAPVKDDLPTVQRPSLGPPNAAPPPSFSAPPHMVRASHRRAPVIAAAAVAALVAGGGAWLGLAAVFGDGDRSAEQDRLANEAREQATLPARPAVTPVLEQREPCPLEMALIDREGRRFCIDKFEAPGRGRMPATGMTRDQAEAACAERLARLCEPDEWELACRGPESMSFPYGNAYRKGLCNADENRDGVVAATGSYAECVSGGDVYDLSGNVAEWVADGKPRGGSAIEGADGRCSHHRRADDDSRFDDVGYRCCRDAVRVAP